MISNRQEVTIEDSNGAVARGLTDEDLLAMFPNRQPVLQHEIMARDQIGRIPHGTGFPDAVHWEEDLSTRFVISTIDPNLASQKNGRLRVAFVGMPLLGLIICHCRT